MKKTFKDLNEGDIIYKIEASHGGMKLVEGFIRESRTITNFKCFTLVNTRGFIIGRVDLPKHYTCDPRKTFFVCKDEATEWVKGYYADKMKTLISELQLVTRNRETTIKAFNEI